MKLIHATCTEHGPNDMQTHKRFFYMFGSSFGMMLFLFQFFYGTHDTDTCDMHCNGNKMKLAVCTGHGTIVSDTVIACYL